MLQRQRPDGRLTLIRLRVRALALAFCIGLCGCAVSAADPRPMTIARVSEQIRAAVLQRAIDPERNSPITVRVNELKGWVVESFTVPGAPPLPSADTLYGAKQLLVDVDPKSIEGDRYFALSTHWMVDKCNTWVISVRRAYEPEIVAAKLKLAPVRCTRLAKRDGSQVFDVVSFTAQTGSFIDVSELETTVRRLQPWNVYGPFVRSVEPDVEDARAVEGFVIKQQTARRYTYRTTFMHAEFGKKRIYDSYILMLAGGSALTVVHATHPVDLSDDDLWTGIATVLESLQQEPHH